MAEVGEALKVSVADGWNRLTVLVALAVIWSSVPARSSVPMKVTVLVVGSGSPGCTVRVTKIVRLAPVGAFGAMAFTIGAYGIGSLRNLAELIATFYATSILFVLIVLGAIARVMGFSILRFIGYIKDELLIVLGTSSSETVLPRMIQKMQRLGASSSVVGLVIPLGYSFNLDGTNIYMTLATLFLAQATNTPLSFGQEITVLLVAMLTSKGASGVIGAGFVTLAATLTIIPDIPIQALAILVGIDKFMSE